MKYNKFENKIKPYLHIFLNLRLLRMGFEPTSRKAYAPQAYMYTNSIT